MTLRPSLPVPAVGASSAARVAASLMLLASCATVAAAQVSPPPPPVAPLAQPVVPLLRPPTAPVPPAPLASSSAALRPATPAVIATPARPGVPADSVRPRYDESRFLPPANAVALCADETFILAPNDATACAAHRGVRVVIPIRALRAPPVQSAAAAAPTPARSVVPVNRAPPAGATMLCKDGTYLTGAPTSDRCASLGGVAAFLPAPRAIPSPPRRP